ncbi:SusD/RagB family nutrient-binding outer membrane lipoprotein [Terrimonas pollutisoli]|uniref:SusD/RagB family nutrient-binding outer membrane lipoprotein n=1 Tax=Terrimonas pollutisoli TaxID=3034147 RepID=UPI0023EC8DDA|nr:SusD/RagB family nutrient-binding outer membrane lipoprotein [Terrimonas sp. H1YJ31]
MKNNLIKKLAIGIGCICVLGSCDKGFEKLNENPNAYVIPDPNSIFTLSEVYMNGQNFENHRANLIYTSEIVQHLASYGYPGDKYTYVPEWSGAFYGSSYGLGIKETTQLLTSIIPDEAENANKRSAVRIIRAYVFHRLTDLYGDVPYFDAGKGYTDLLFKPKFDKQSDIYADLLKELDESAQAFDASKPFFGSADLFYAGDVSKWKKFAYSLMLRLGMRLTKVDAAKAQQWVAKAIAGGVFQSNADNLVLNHETGPSGVNQNPYTTPYLGEDLQNGTNGTKMGQTFINQLKNTSDPRLRIYARLENSGDNTPANQKGLPNGFTAATITSHPSWTAAGLPAYSDPNTLTILRQDAPDIIMSYAEVQFLLAEAAVRGWDSGSALTYYNNGVTAAMKMLAVYGTAVPPVTDAEIAAYLVAHPFLIAGTDAEKFNQIHTQKWIAFFFNGLEAFADLRRSGYPLLTPVNYPGNLTGGKLPRRLIYDESEKVNNADNYAAAIAQQGADDFNTRVWWDKP